MDNFTEPRAEEQFAIGQSGRDLRVRPDAIELEIQLMDAIDNLEEFLRFVEISSRIAINQRRLFEKWKPASSNTRTQESKSSTHG